MSYSIEAVLGCERAVITINRPNHVKIPFLSDLEVDRESLGVRTEHFGTNSKFFERKSPCKLAFQNKQFKDVSDLAWHSVPSGPRNYICPVVLKCTRRAKGPRREEKCWK